MENKKVVLLPLDERPCNYEFPVQLFNSDSFRIVRPNQLGDKKKPADLRKIREFLITECKEAQILVLSMDMLLYGGLIPSRLHHLTEDEVNGQLEVVREVKKLNPALKIYAFQCIMRCPAYSSSDEEPDYYETCGLSIHRYGAEIHREQANETSLYDKQKLLEEIPKEALEDYTARRAFNLSYNLRTLELLEDKVLDVLVIPQDDSAPFGYTALDQAQVRQQIREKKMWDEVLVYPGADEVGMTLLARAMNELHHKTPKVYIKYASVKAPFVIPSYEDRYLAETVKYHLMAAGLTTTDTVERADFVLALSAGSGRMLEASSQPANTREYDIDRNLIEFTSFIEGCVKSKIPVTIGDNAYGNGSDLELVAILNKKGILLEVAGYAGWNTSSNTIGTALASGVRYLYYGNDKIHKQFLLLRYLEDAGYCALVRRYITDHELSKLGMNYFNVRECDGVVSEMVRDKLIEFLNNSLSSIAPYAEIVSVTMPWRRMFETKIQVRYHSNQGGLDDTKKSEGD